MILRGVSIEGLYDQSQTSLGIDGLLDKITNTSDTSSSSPGWYTKIVRLPVDPYPPESYYSDATYVTDILKPAVDYATKKGLYAIIDWTRRSRPLHPGRQRQPVLDPDRAHVQELLQRLLRGLQRVQSDGYVGDLPDHASVGHPDPFLCAEQYHPCGQPGVGPDDGRHGDQSLTGTNIAYTVQMNEQHYASTYLQGQVTKAAAVHPVVMTEWGYCDCSGQPGIGNLGQTYGTAMLTWLEGMNGGWTAWCASNSWLPDMFDANWNLLVGANQEGGFVKDWMYTHRNN